MPTTVKCNNFDCEKNTIYDESRTKGYCTLDDIELDCTGECISGADIGGNDGS